MSDSILVGGCPGCARPYSVPGYAATTEIGCVQGYWDHQSQSLPYCAETRRWYPQPAPPAPTPSSELEECDPMDDNQDHHEWSSESLPVCLRCGVLSQAWEE